MYHCPEIITQGKKRYISTQHFSQPLMSLNYLFYEYFPEFSYTYAFFDTSDKIHNYRCTLLTTAFSELICQTY